MMFLSEPKITQIKSPTQILTNHVFTTTSRDVDTTDVEYEMRLFFTLHCFYLN